MTFANVANDFDCSETFVRNVAISNGLRYFQKTSVTPLDDEHKGNRVIFINQFSNIDYQILRPIIFTDESTIVNCAHQSGIWRIAGHHPPDSYYQKQSHLIQVMVLGGISNGGFRTNLLWFSRRVTKEYYISQLENNKIFTNLNIRFGHSWVWQEDNASPHRARYTKLFSYTSLSKAQLAGKIT